MASSSGNKTEKPTPQRLKKAREQGQFLAARGLVGGIQFLAIVVLISRLVPQLTGKTQRSMAMLVARSMAGEIGESEWLFLLRELFQNLFLPIVASGGILLLITTGTHLAVTKMGFSLQRFVPKADRLNPFSRLRELPQQNLKSLLEAIVLLGVLVILIYSLAANYGAQLLRLPFEAVPVAAAQVGNSLEDMLWKAAAVFVVFGSVDLFRQYRQYTSRLRMTKEEVKEEHKRNEGDPQLKARIRRLRRELLRRQMMRQVPQATAVVVNPTHFAVAIRYEAETMSCPVLVAKGKNWLALRIRHIAQEHEVPIIENPPLARALYDSIDVGGVIPPEFYQAVAEILAYIYRLMGRKLPN